MGIKSFFKRESNEKGKKNSRPPYGFVLNQRGIYDFITGYTPISETVEF